MSYSLVSVITHQLTSWSETLNLAVLCHCCAQMSHVMHVIILEKRQKLLIEYDL